MYRWASQSQAPRTSPWSQPSYCACCEKEVSRRGGSRRSCSEEDRSPPPSWTRQRTSASRFTPATALQRWPRRSQPHRPALRDRSRAVALDKHKTAYVGGTLTQFDNATGRIEGRLDVTDARQLMFTPDGDPADDRTVRIEYATIQDLEFGQKVSRRLTTTLVAAALAGPLGLLTPSNRRHYLTITYVDAHCRTQVLMLELGDEVVRRTLTSLERRSGKPIEFRDEESRRWSR